MANRSQPTKDHHLGYVGIDFGSTATRGVIVVKRGNQVMRRRYEIADVKGDGYRRCRRGEFPSVGCPFDCPGVLVGYDAAKQKTKRTVSLKSIVYFLACDNDESTFTRALREHVSSFSAPKEKEDFRGHLKELLSQFFKEIIADALTLGEEWHFDICSVTLSIPNTWSSIETNVQNYLSQIVDNIVCGRAIETTFIFEADALAQWLLFYRWRPLQGHEYLMVLDFGGHSLDGTHGAIRWGTCDVPFLDFPPKHNFGALGGYEIWEIEVGKIIDEQMPKQQGHRKKLLDKYWNLIRAELLESFMTHRPDTASYYHLCTDIWNHLDKDEQVLFREDSPDERIVELPCGTGSDFCVEIPVEVIDAAWETAYRPILNMAKENIRSVAEKEGNGNLFIFLSGGSIDHPKARNEIEELCGHMRSNGNTRNEITLEWAWEVGVPGLKWMQADGAARAPALTVGVEAFFDRGAALAIQNSTFKGDWGPNTSMHAKLLFCKKAGIEKYFTVDVSPRDDTAFGLIADPNFINAKRKSADLSAVFSRNSYNILDLSSAYEPTSGAPPHPIPPGEYNIGVSDMKYEGQHASLTLRLCPVKRGDLSKEGRALYLEVPLVLQRENNLVTLDQGFIEDNFWKPRADPRADPRSVG